MLHWVYLALAIACEIIATTSMKLSEGFTRPAWAVVMTLGYTASFTFITLALKRLPLGLSYAIWAGAGTAAAAFIGAYVFHEPMSALKIAGVGLVLVGVVLLRLSGTA